MRSQTLALRAGILCLSAALSVACDSGKKQASRNDRKEIDKTGGSAQAAPAMPKGFLAASDLARPGSLKKMSVSELEETLNGEDNLFLPVDEGNDDRPNCISQEMRKFQAKKNDGRWTVVEGSADVSHCNNEPIEKSFMRFFLAQSSQQSAPDKIETINKITNTLMNMTIKLDDEEISNKFVMAVGMEGKPCESSGVDIKNCEKLVVGTWARKKEGLYNDYKRFILRDLKGKKGDQHFSSGTVEFDVNDWEGVITYKGGDIPPTWTAQKGSEKASGTLERSKD